MWRTMNWKYLYNSKQFYDHFFFISNNYCYNFLVLILVNINKRILRHPIQSPLCSTKQRWRVNNDWTIFLALASTHHQNYVSLYYFHHLYLDFILHTLSLTYILFLVVFFSYFLFYILHYSFLILFLFQLLNLKFMREWGIFPFFIYLF